ncbi:uncharacterized protein KY384_001812 [Bacidia gigantensis]|uniref:uncharacterized protein n=1 Tax=Bacidia gigantensis TaxID=2732470 RepID=UPI001D03C0C7|nr:uncharacterized protein KY384_001812 [Bacidia gigantensis]KAG8533029.1 hypothetical protein KY384_001812 [Bacidia gigantensis]
MATVKEAVIAKEHELEEEYADINEKALLRKLDYTLLPAVTSLYLLSFLDRSNVANARIEGLVKDLKITGDQYLTCLTIYFIGYVLFEVPCNIILKRTSPRAWLPTLTLAWGIVATLLGVTQNFGGFLAARFFLGVTESGLFPGVVFYLSMWYKRNEQHYRVALFFSAASLAGAFGGILAWGIAHMKGVGGLNGWRWIFILEGILTVLVSAASYFFIANYPDTAEFLSDRERSFIHARLAANSDATRNEAFTWSNVSTAFKDYKVWLATNDCTPYSVAFVLTLTVAVLSERYRIRAPFIMASSSIAIIGYIILLSNPLSRPGVSYFGTILAAAGIYPATALVLAWPANNVSGQTKRATANAMQISIGNLGAVLGTQLYRTETAPKYLLGHSFALAYLIFNVAVVGTLGWILKRENEKRDREVSEGKVVLTDYRDDEWGGDEDKRWRFQT